MTGWARSGIAATATLAPAFLLIHALAALFHVAPGPSPGTLALGWAMAAVALFHTLLQRRSPHLSPWIWSLAPLAAALALAFATRASAGPLALAVIASAQGFAQSRVARALPTDLDGVFRRRPWRASAWTLLALLAVVQTARLASHQADIEVPWWVTTRNPAWTSHQCAAMYVYAADLDGQGEANLYADEHYPPFEELETVSHSSVENLERHLECGFEYPPPFLLLPWTLLRFTNDFYVIRPLWFGVQGLLLLASAVALALWVGGPRGRLALWLLPAFWAGVPTLQTFQFGQFHLSAFALSLLGMMALHQRKNHLGAALLGAAIVTKIFPAVLLLVLAAQHRWRQIGVTLLWMAGLAGVGAAILGIAPYEAFLTYKLPRILDGSAFISPADGDSLVAILTGITSLPWRLRILGLHFVPEGLGTWLGRALAVGILVLAWRSGRGAKTQSASVLLWLALLNLTVLDGPTAFSDYTPATSLWLLCFVSIEMARSRFLAVGLSLCWLQMATLVGTFPLPGEPTALQVAASTTSITLLALWLNLWCAARAPGDGNGDHGPASATLPTP